MPLSDGPPSSLAFFATNDSESCPAGCAPPKSPAPSPAPIVSVHSRFLLSPPAEWLTSASTDDNAAAAIAPLGLSARRRDYIALALPNRASICHNLSFSTPSPGTTMFIVRSRCMPTYERPHPVVVL